MQKITAFEGKGIFDDRNLLQNWLHLSLAYQLNTFCMIFVCFHAFVYLVANDQQLPFNCYLFFLPLDESLLAWELNYLVITVVASFAGLIIIFYVPIPFVLMNQSCWLIDMALITADNLNEELLRNEEGIRKPEQCRKVNENLKLLVSRCQQFVEWLFFCRRNDLSPVHFLRGSAFLYVLDGRTSLDSHHQAFA